MSVPASVVTHNPGDLEDQIDELLRIRDQADETAAFLISVLDARSEDPDLEDNGDEEPSLGWTKTGHLGGWAGFYNCDLEEGDPLEDDGDLEPYLAGSHSDREFDEAELWEGRS